MKIAALLLATGLLNWLFGNFDPTNKHVTEAYHTAVSSAAHLVVNAKNGDVKIKPGPAGTLTITATKHLRGNEDPNDLDVRIDKNGNEIGVTEVVHNCQFNCGSIDFLITAPADSSLDTNTTNGDVTVQGLTGAMHVATSNGDVHLDGAASNVQSSSSNGDVVVSFASVESVRDVTLSSTNGDVVVNLPSSTALHTVDLGTTNGDIVSQFGFSGGRHLHATMSASGVDLTMHTTNGDLHINKG